MLFITHWKVNEAISAEEVLQIGQTLTDEGLFPPDGVTLHRWDATPDGWGVCVWEADEYAALNRGLGVWRASASDVPFFEETTTAPAIPVEDWMAEMPSMLEDLPTR